MKISKIFTFILLWMLLLNNSTCSATELPYTQDVEIRSATNVAMHASSTKSMDSNEILKKSNADYAVFHSFVVKNRKKFTEKYENFQDKLIILAPYGLAALAVLGKCTQQLPPLAMAGGICCGWLLSDLGTGVVHFTFDVLDYTNPKLPRNMREAAKIFQYHHDFPGDCTQESFWYQTRGFYLNFGVPLLAIAGILGAYNYDTASCLIATTAILAPLGNYVHALSHGKHNNRFVRLLQHAGLIISRDHHRLHHKDPGHSKHYCIWNGHMNVVLDPVISACRAVYKFFNKRYF